jgi:DNA-binding Xre family transcriptional regulator
MMRNKIKQFVDSRGITVYRFREMTGISNKTAYDLVNKPKQYPSREVMQKICSTFKVQPGELIEWVED